MGSSSSKSAVSKVTPAKKNAKGGDDDDDKVGLGGRVMFRQVSDANEKKAFDADGAGGGNMSNPAHFELRKLLDDPIGQAALGKFAREVFTIDSFFCWIDIQTFKSIPTTDYMRCTATHIYAKYIAEDAVLQVGSLSHAERESLTARCGRKDFTSDMYNFVQNKCFLDIFHNTFLRFKSKQEYKVLNESIKTSYNRVGPDDFEYMEWLGKGAYGIVIHVKKKSTGKHYALKMQLKTALIETYADDLNRLDCERTVFSACRHPYIVGLDYAFQSANLVFLVLEFATAGSLSDALKAAPDMRLSEARVRFYIAEIVLALDHLHELGLMYRDLKPGNVLLDGDGHCYLADMGSVGQFAGNLLEKKNVEEAAKIDEEEKAAPIENIVEEVTDHKTGEKVSRLRRTSVLGTAGYMAPEMVKLLGQGEKQEIKGYTKAVDYWSLGCTAFKLMCGARPFDNAEVDYSAVNPEYEMLLTKVDFPAHLSQEAVNFIQGLLNVTEAERLGALTVANVKQHPWFTGIDWDKLLTKHIIPPYIPGGISDPREKPLYAGWKQVYDELENADENESDLPGYYDWTEVPTDEEQNFFESWDYISPHTLAVEMGIQKEAAAKDSTFMVPGAEELLTPEQVQAAADDAAAAR
jgi:serine/threonine protein kinase